MTLIQRFCVFKVRSDQSLNTLSIRSVMSLRDRTVICITKFKVGPQVGLGLGDGGIYYAMTEAGSKDRTPMFNCFF